jgi:hypothetical protein
MKIKYEIFAVVAIAAIGIMFLAGCKTLSPAEIEGPQSIIGFNGPLKLVAKYKPLHLYIYADVTSTNKHPDYIIFYRNEPLVISDNKSNTVEISLWEKNFQGNLLTTYNQNGQILKRIFGTQNNDSMQTNYLYFDTNGDGQWDKFLIDEKNGSIKAYDRSNLCWVPRVGKK